MNILITGGFGHLGSELIKVLSAKKKIRKIFIIDNFLTQRFCSFINLENKKKIILYDENVTKFKFSNIKSKVDKVVHLAAITNAEESIKNQKEVIKNNLHSTKMVVNFCKKEKIPLIFASSTSVYGDQFKTINSKNNQHKDMLKPQSPYAKCKIYEEEYIKSNIKNYTILRLGTICGISEGMRFHTAINKFCYQAVLSKPITIWRKLYTKQRPYLVLNDFTKLILFILFNKNIVGTYDAVTENCSVVNIIKNINLYIKKINIKFVNTKILNQKSYVVIPDAIINKGFKFKGKILDEIKRTIQKLS